MAGSVAILAPQQAAHSAVVPAPVGIRHKPAFPSRAPDLRKAREHERLRNKDIFVCDEESQFYSMCVSKMALKECRNDEQVIEFGTGDGSPVIHALESWGRYGGVIHGFEINPSAAAAARHNAAAHGVAQSYKVQNSCFFKGLEQASPSMLIANPPYIAAPDDDILMPALHGGIDGAVLTRTLMSLGLDKAMLLISSYSNPVETLEHARSEGYILRDFMLTSMPFGTYSSEPKVMNWITRMKRENRAFFTPKTYLLAGVLLVKAQASAQHQDDLTDELLSIMTALH